MLDIPSDFPIYEHPKTAYCVVTASRRYEVPPETLVAMLITEGGRPGMKKPNKNGSFDLGPMQINTVWLREQSPLHGYVSEATLQYDLCTNIHAATWILAWNLSKFKDIWTAVGKYHAPYNEGFAQNYRVKVNAQLEKAKKVVFYNEHYQKLLAQFWSAQTKQEISFK